MRKIRLNKRKGKCKKKFNISKEKFFRRDIICLKIRTITKTRTRTTAKTRIRTKIRIRTIIRILTDLRVILPVFKTGREFKAYIK